MTLHVEIHFYETKDIIWNSDETCLTKDFHYHNFWRSLYLLCPLIVHKSNQKLHLNIQLLRNKIYLEKVFFFGMKYFI